ncbi:GNAT family N-acetyltransferase [Brevibacillus migulae]|uniref:GNAT family N-acetyltransferase n=1 Tax=Brevibacillus migulae TaxID=1644114 RepID=UPI00106E316B|nr:GNAT family N-acetyltransferase [Brevibacillus migulae]
MNHTLQIRVVSKDEELQDALTVRRLVFIEEQEVPEDLEIDEHDTLSSPTIHFVAYQGDTPVGASRLRTYQPGVGKIERVAVLGSTRGTGLGRAIMEFMEETARANGYAKVKLNAQCHAQGFYEKLGYVPYGDIFDDAGIPHIAMEKVFSE